MNEAVKKTDKAQAPTITAEKLHAEIAKLIAETSLISAETVKINAELAKTRSETLKLTAEATKINKETYWYPLAIATAFVGGIIALTKIFL